MWAKDFSRFTAECDFDGCTFWRGPVQLERPETSHLDGENCGTCPSRDE
jgi:hypothetical protein